MTTRATPRDRLSQSAELQRKLIHLASVVVPLGVWVMPRAASIAVLSALTVTAFGIEWSRRHLRGVRHFFLRRTRRLLRGHERSAIAGATWMALGYLLVVVVFPRPIAVAAMLYNACGDSIAALVGKRWGHHRLKSGKSLEGGLAGFTANLVVGALVPGIPPAAVLLGAAVAASLELLPLPVDDNLTVTLGGGAALWMGTRLASFLT